jgi:DNA-binding MarR family transcriptional regulator
MLNRKQYIEELIEGGEALRRHMLSFHAGQKKAAAITPSQWLVVRHIFKHEGCTTNDAATALNMSGSAVTQLVNALAAKKYVKRERDPIDKRAHRLLLSAESKKRISEMRRKRVTVLLGLFKALSDKEFVQYVALHHKIQKSFTK